MSRLGSWYKRHGRAGVSPGKGHGDSERVGEFVIRGELELFSLKKWNFSAVEVLPRMEELECKCGGETSSRVRKSWYVVL